MFGEFTCFKHTFIPLLTKVYSPRVETLIPKSDLGRVMVVKGEKAGEIGEIINR